MTAKFTSVRFQIPSDSFTNVPGALFYFYEAGTTNLVTVYADANLGTPLSNPVEADGYGLFPDIFLVPDLYDILAKDADGVTLWESADYEVQDIPVLNSNFFSLIDDEYYPAIAVNTQTGTSYTILNADRASLITFNNASGGTITLPTPSGANFPNKWYCYVSNIGSGSFTISTTTTINGSATYALAPNSFTLIASDGSVYSAGASVNDNEIFIKTGGTLTIATGAVTIAAYSQYLIDTESAAATDDLDTISGGVDGKLLVLRIVNAARDVVLKHNTGNIYNPAGQDITLSATQDIAFLRYDSNLTKWVVIAFQNASTALLPLTLGTSQATTSGTSIDFTGIPTTANRVVLSLSGVSGSGTSIPLIQCRVASAAVTSGYLGRAGYAVTGISSTAGLAVSDNSNAVDTLFGSATFTRITGNTWSMVGTFAQLGQNKVTTGAASITLAGDLDGVRLTTVNGTDTFDAGTANIIYE